MSIDRAKVTKEAERLLAAGKYERSLEELRKLLEDKPGDPIMMNKIGDLCLQARKVRRTRREFDASAAPQGELGPRAG